LLVATLTGSAESTPGKGYGVSTGYYFDVNNFKFGGVGTSSETTGFLVDAGFSLDFYKGESSCLTKETYTKKICIAVVCINWHTDSNNDFYGLGFGLFGGTETGFGGGFSHHKNETELDR